AMAQLRKLRAALGVLALVEPQAPERRRLGAVDPQHARLYFAPARAHLFVSIKHRIHDLVRRIAAQHHAAVGRIAPPMMREKVGALAREARIALAQPLRQLRVAAVRPEAGTLVQLLQPARIAAPGVLGPGRGQSDAREIYELR